MSRHNLGDRRHGVPRGRGVRAGGVQVLHITGPQHVVVTTTADHVGHARRTGEAVWQFH